MSRGQAGKVALMHFLLLLAPVVASCVSPDTISAAVEQAQAVAEQAAGGDPSGAGSLLTNPLTILEIALIALLTRWLGPLAKPIVGAIMALVVGILGKKNEPPKA